MQTLYHYTDAGGLQGIVASRSFWASDYRFLNDSSEFYYGYKILIGALDKREGDVKSASSSAWENLENFRRHLGRTGVHAFVASFSTEGDLLSQWRGYNGGRGFSIGIAADWLNTNAVNQDFQLFPVSYNEIEQKEASDMAVGLLISLLEELGEDESRLLETLRSWWRHAMKVALTFKDDSFKEECEYRLAYISDFWPVGINTRGVRSGLIPYVSCSFDNIVPTRSLSHPNNRGLEIIRVGPALKDNQIQAVDALLASQHMRIEIIKSSIPFVSD